MRAGLDKYGHNPELRRKRRLEMLAKGLCAVHGTPVQDGKKHCPRCSLNNILRSCLKAKRRRERLSAGLCPVHADRRIVEGRTKCEKCLLNTRISALRVKGLPVGELDRARQAVTEWNGCCDCCGSRESGNGYRGFVLDHDDRLKLFRGILCHGCNLAIGHAKEDVIRLMQMIRYLQSVCIDWRPKI